MFGSQGRNGSSQCLMSRPRSLLCALRSQVCSTTCQQTAAGHRLETPSELRHQHTRHPHYRPPQQVQLIPHFSLRVPDLPSLVVLILRHPLLLEVAFSKQDPRAVDVEQSSPHSSASSVLPSCLGSHNDARVLASIPIIHHLFLNAPLPLTSPYPRR